MEPSAALLLEDELDWELDWADAETQRPVKKRDAARHRPTTAACGRDCDLVEGDTIGIRRSYQA
jgi:hypothetical protein